MKIAIGNPEKDSYHGWSPFLVFKNEVEARSGGRLKVELLPLILGKSKGDELSLAKEGVVQAQGFSDSRQSRCKHPELGRETVKGKIVEVWGCDEEDGVVERVSGKSCTLAGLTRFYRFEKKWNGKE